MRLWERLACSFTVALSLIGSGAMLSGCAGTSIISKISKDGVTIEVKNNPDGSGSGKITAPGIPPGKCIKIAFLNARKEPIGAITTNVPGEFPIPAGTTDFTLETVDCPPAPGAGPVGATPGARSHQLVSQTVEISGAPLVFDEADGGMFKNAVYHFRVTSPNGSAWNDVLPLLLGGPGTPVPSNVEVLYFSQTIPDPLGARLRVADTQAFTKFRLDWNGTYGYADLASGTNVIQYGAGNNWSVVETFIPGHDINGLGQWNELIATSRTQGASTDTVVSASVQVLP